MSLLLHRLLVVAALIVSCCAMGCAKGGAGNPPGRGDGGRSDGNGLDGAIDSGTPRDSGGRDTTLRTDAGPCGDEGHSPSCAMATDLGTIDVGAPAMRITGIIPVTGGEDWVKIGFPYRGTDMMMIGGGHPRITFSVNEGGFVLETRTRCAAGMACGGDGMAARDLTEWDFVDEDPTGESTFATRDVEWPVELFIRIYRMSGPGSCAGYELTIER